MEIELLEILLWAGLIFFFWALKENLGNVEADLQKIEEAKLRAARNPPKPRFVSPDGLSEPIGHYRDATIYGFAIIAGRRFRFDSICPLGSVTLSPDQACLPPGLLYVACDH
ncbi:MAG: hypothetical protein JWR21_3133 [Herminiimonas sp.]|nr:hypothetical protein [Herminiimonas sp.]MDB5853864.1 hypothetical protein [Herminiimonas sp.]